MAPEGTGITVPTDVSGKLDSALGAIPAGKSGRLDLTAAYQPLTGQTTAEASVGWRTGSGWELGVWGGGTWGPKRDAAVGVRARKEW